MMFKNTGCGHCVLYCTCINIVRERVLCSTAVCCLRNAYFRTEITKPVNLSNAPINYEPVYGWGREVKRKRFSHQNIYIYRAYPSIACTVPGEAQIDIFF